VRAVAEARVLEVLEEEVEEENPEGVLVRVRVRALVGTDHPYPAA
tara:strand:- start:888 stop:1022 length:135 start_codon:yes stop_codon:yes gene_type:complete